MSAEDVPSADQADIGEALVAALGFEPAEGRKVGKKNSAAIVDPVVDNPGADATSNGTSEAGDADDDGEEPLSVVSPENQQGPESDNAGSSAAGSGTANKSGQNRSGSKKRNRNRNRNRNNNNRNAHAAGSGNKTDRTESSDADADSGTDIKSAAKPTVNGGQVVDEAATTEGDGGSPASNSSDSSTAAGAAADTDKTQDEPKARNGLSDTAIGTTVEMAMPAAAAVTGEIQIVPESATPPPPPTGADAITIDESPSISQAAATTITTTPPTAPPAMPAETVGEDKVARAERMAAAAKAQVQVDVPAEVAPVVDTPPITVQPSPEIEIISPEQAAPVTASPSRSLPSLSRDGSIDLSQVRNLLRRKRRVQARKVRRVIRHIDPWSVLTFSVLFHLCVFAALLLASVLVWNAAESAGTIENLETFILELGDYETFEIKGDVVFRAAVAIAGVLTLASSVLLVLLTVVFNLISDLVGGIRLTVIEEETVRVRRRKKA